MFHSEYSQLPYIPDAPIWSAVAENAAYLGKPGYDPVNRVFTAVEPDPIPSPTEEPTGKSVTIVGGEDATPGQFPWQIYLKANNGRCGAVYIKTSRPDKTIGLTAHHCVVNAAGEIISPNLVSGVFGDHTKNQVDIGPDGQPTEQFSQVSEIYGSGEYNPYFTGNQHGDFAVLVFSTLITETDYIKPIEVTTAAILAEFAASKGITDTSSITYTNSYSISEILTGEVATTTGWGKVAENGPTSNILKFVLVPIVDAVTSTLNYGSHFSSGMIGAGLPEGGKDSCQGDSGGPLVIFIDDVQYLLGLTSTGRGCAQPNSEGLYTYLPAFEEELNQIITNLPSDVLNQKIYLPIIAR